MSCDFTREGPSNYLKEECEGTTFTRAKAIEFKNAWRLTWKIFQRPAGTNNMETKYGQLNPKKKCETRKHNHVFQSALY